MHRTKIIVAIAVALVLATAGTAYAVAGGPHNPPAGQTTTQATMRVNVQPVRESATVGSDETTTTEADETTTEADETTTTVVEGDDESTTETTDACETDDSSEGWGDQRSDETLLTGDTLAAVLAAAVAAAPSDATVVRVETDADGNAAYEVHMVKADGTLLTVYVDESFNVVSIVEQQAGEQQGGEQDQTQTRDCDGTGDQTQTQTQDQNRDQTQTQAQDQNRGQDQNRDQSPPQNQNQSQPQGGTHQGR
jgi:hypothetical protein